VTPPTATEASVSATDAPATASGTSSAASTGAPTVAGADLGRKISDAMAAARSGRAVMSSTGSLALTGRTEFVFVDPTHIDSHATMTIGPQSLELVSKGGQLYMKGLPTGTTGGKPWVRIDPNGTDPVSKAMAGAAQQAGNPQAMADAFKGSSATVVDAAAGQTHYRLSGGDTGAGDLYVDGQGRPVRFLAEASGTRVEVAYSDWGAPVTVTEPPADQVGSISPAG